MDISIIKYKDLYKNDVEDICYETGYSGESLEGKHIFNDKNLFYYLFCDYYLQYERDNCFVAFDTESQKAVGYIIGTLNTKRQELLFIIRYIPKIIFRLFTTTIFKNYESFQSVIYFLKSLELIEERNIIYERFPAHFHINISPEYQHYGIGTKLLYAFENHIKSLNINGVHLRTSSLNTKAIPFYEKNGFTLFKKRLVSIWRDSSPCYEIILTKDFRGKI